MKINRNYIIIGVVVVLLAALLLSLRITSYLLRDARLDPEPIACDKNMKQIGLSLRLFATDHLDQFPFNLSTNKDGTLEYCSVDKDGFDINTYKHFMVMSNELGTPSVLVCPKDRSKHITTNFGELQPMNVTYRLRTGPNITESNTNEILAVCPVDGNILYCNGTVKLGK